MKSLKLIILALLTLNVVTFLNKIPNQQTKPSIQNEKFEAFYLKQENPVSLPSADVSVSTSIFSTSTIPPTTTTHTHPLPVTTTIVHFTKEDNRTLGRRMMLEAGFSEPNWPCLEALWTRESGWDENSVNRSSGAAGIPQALPPSKMGKGWQGNALQQINWGLDYIKSRYNTPCNADAFQRRRNWY